jgi:membrane fusion protein
MVSFSLPPLPPGLLWPPAPRLRWSLLLAVLAGLLAVVLALALLPYPRSETLQGWLAPEGGLLQLRAPQVGVLGPLLVAPGTQVAADAPLLLVYSPDRVRLEAEHDRLLLEWRRAEALKQDQTARRQAGQAASRALREALDQAAAQNRRAQGHAQKQLETLEALLAPVLSPGAAPALQLPVMLKAQAQLQRFGAESQLLRLLQEARGLHRERAQLALTETRQRQAEAEAGEALASRLAALEAQLGRLRAQRRWVLRAPQGGRLLTLPGTPGDSLEAGALLATLAPGAGTLEAVFPLTAATAGAGAPGQALRLSLESFPAHRYGTLPGRVRQRSLAHGRGQPERLHVTVLPAAPGPARALPPLEVGMAVQGVLKLEPQSALGRMLEPLRRSLGP